MTLPSDPVVVDVFVDEGVVMVDVIDVDPDVVSVDVGGVDGTVAVDVAGVAIGGVGGGSPSGVAGGVLGGTYPNPSFATDMATQAELNAAIAGVSSAPSGPAGGVLTGTYPNPGLAVGAVGLTHIQSDSIVTAHLQAGSVGSEQVADNSIGTDHLVDLSVTGPKIADGAVTNTELASVPIDTVKGRASPQTGSGAPTDLNTGQLTSLILPFTDSAKGAAPASGGGTTNFLRADGTWVAPAGGGGGAPSGPAGGVLSGTYPNPGFAVDMATQAELNAKVAGHVIWDAGVPEAQRSILDFQDGFVVTDDSGSDRTNVRADVAAPTSLNTAGSSVTGSATTLARSDHVHAIPSTLDTNARHAVKKDGTLVGTRRGINFVTGANTTLTVTDDAANEEVDITIASTGGGGGLARFAQDVGNGTATSFTVTHSLGTRDVTVAVYRNSGSYDEIICDVQHTSTTVVTLVFDVAPTTNEYRVCVVG